MSPYAAILVAAFLGVVAAHPGGRGKCSANLTVTVDDCCKIPQLANQTVLDRCRKQFPFKHEHGKDGEERLAKRRQAGACVAQCILTATGGFKKERLDTKGFKKALKPVFDSSSSDMSQLLRRSIDECAQNAEVDPGFLQNAGPKDDSKPMCPVTPMWFINCVYTTVFEKCPRSEWNDVQECKALNGKLKDGCPYFALRKHPKRDD